MRNSSASADIASVGEGEVWWRRKANVDRVPRSGASSRRLYSTADSKPFFACDANADAHLLAAMSVLSYCPGPHLDFSIAAHGECPEASRRRHQRRHRDRAVCFTLEVRQCPFLRAQAALISTQLPKYLRVRVTA
jgi:hypothetical protein